MNRRTRTTARHPALTSLAARLAGEPGVAVYCGEGASHSWIWFTELLERLETFDVRYITHRDVLAGELDSRDLMLVGGGDTYAMARSLGPAGASRLEEFVREGGFYHGSCAGAYLVLRGVDMEPFNPFRLVDAGMLNVMADPPAPLCLEHKYLAPYGEEWVFHPVYGEVALRARGPARDMLAFRDAEEIAAPLFGGPVMSAAGARAVADYASATPRAAYLWPGERAGGFMAGRQAVVFQALGDGAAVASGPHLEHPLFPAANALVAELFADHWEGVSRRRAAAGRGGPPPRGKRGRDRRRADSLSLLEIKRQVSNARIVGYGLERSEVTWKIGVKVWEPEKIRMFLQYAWERLPYMERRAAAGAFDAGEELEELALGYARASALAKELSVAVRSNQESQAEATSLLTMLKELTAGFLSLYFELRLEERRSGTDERGGTGTDG